MITDRDIRQQVIEAISGSDLDNDVETVAAAVTEEIIATHGLVGVDAVDADTFWTMVIKHDAPQQ